MAGEIKHSWTGTVLTITSDSGTSSCDLKGEKGDDGCRGAQGVAGAGLIDDTLTKKGFAADAMAIGDNFNLVNGRIDELIALPDGSTTADAELRDIRLDYKGRVYGSAGTAVRNSFIGIDNRVTNLEDITEDMQSSQSQQAKRILNIEKRFANEPFEVDEDWGAAKAVPTGVMPYAAVNKVGGMSYKTRNLLEVTATTKTVNGVTFTVNTNGSVHARGTATALTILDLGEISSKLTVGKTYKMSGMHACRIVKADGTISYPADAFIYTSDITAIYPYLQVGNGVTITQNYYPMVIESTETNTLFEKYYSGIRNAAVTRVIATGKNLLKAPETATVQAANNIINTVPCYLKANHTYIFFFNNPSKIATQAFFSDKYGNVNVMFYPLREEKPYNVFTPTEDIYLMRLFYNGAGTITQPMVVEGSEIVDYEAYKVNTLSIPTGAMTVGYGLGINENYYNYIDWERKVFVKRCVKLTGFTKEHSYANYSAWSITRPENVAITDFGGICSYNAPLKNADDDTAHWYVGNTRIWLYAPLNVDVSTEEVIVPLTYPEEIDISEYLPDDNFIEVVEGGAVIAVNEYNYDTKYELEYMMGG